MTSLPLFPLPQKSPLVGIARLASQGESLREGHNVEYFTLPAKSILNRCTSRRGLPFTWTINPYRGCEFACKYCYARHTHEFMEMRDGVEFEQRIYIKQHTADLLRRALRRVQPGAGIADSPANLEAVVTAAAAAGARHIFAGPLFLKPCSAAVFLPFLEQHFPHLVENYRERYRDRSFLPPSYGKRVAQLIARFRQKYGITRADPRGTIYASKWPV